MPTATINDNDLMKIFQEMGFNANVIVRKSINEKGEIEIVWKHG